MTWKHFRGAALAALLAAGTAQANNTGIFGKSGRDAEGGTCTQCHIGQNGAAPTIEVTGLDSDLYAGGSTEITITITRSDPAGGIADAACPDRCAGFNAAVDSGAGAFVVPEGAPLITNGPRDEVSHLAKSAFVDGKVNYTMVLTGLAAGSHTLFVAANDVNGQEATGDRVGTLALPFNVSADAPVGPPSGDGEEQGCTQTGAGTHASLAALLLGLAALSRGRRRRSTTTSALALAASIGVCFAADARADSAKPAAPAAATAAEGKNHMDNCPTAVVGAATKVKDVPGGVELTVTGAADATKAIRARAKALADASKANARVAKHDGKGSGGGRSGRCAIVMVKSTVAVADAEGGSTITVKADDAADVEWLRNETRARLDEQAQAAAGHGKMAHCPSALDGAVTKVTDTKDGVVVTVTGAGDVAKEIRTRTAALLKAAAEPEDALGHDGHGTGGGGFGRCPVIVKDTTLTAKDVEGGAEVTVAAKTPAQVAALQKEARERALRLSGPASAAPKAPGTK